VSIKAYILLLLGWIAWFLPFVLASRRHSRTPSRVDRRARWGIALQALGYALLWQGRFWLRTPAAWQVIVSGLCFVLASLLAWSGTHALGQHWRVDAGLNADHRLVRNGPYRIVRHPIYASMLWMAVGTGLLVAPWPLLVVSLVLVIVGIEIRVRVEDVLLETHFGAEFRAYKHDVAAYVPLVR